MISEKQGNLERKKQNGGGGGGANKNWRVGFQEQHASEVEIKQMDQMKKLKSMAAF